MNNPTVTQAVIAATASICVALISFAGGILVAVIGKLPIDKFFSQRTRERNNIPDIMQTKWATEWCFEDGSLYVRDEVTFDKWTKNSEFVGYGEVTHAQKQYKYSIEGEISPSRIVVLTYKAEKYPSQANIGMACLELSSGADKLKGTWAGRASKTLQDGSSVETLRGGRVEMNKIKDLKP